MLAGITRAWMRLLSQPAAGEADTAQNSAHATLFILLIHSLAFQNLLPPLAALPILPAGSRCTWAHLWVHDALSDHAMAQSASCYTTLRSQVTYMLSTHHKHTGIE